MATEHMNMVLVCHIGEDKSFPLTKELIDINVHQKIIGKIFHLEIKHFLIYYL